MAATKRANVHSTPSAKNIVYFGFFESLFEVSLSARFLITVPIFLIGVTPLQHDSGLLHRLEIFEFAHLGIVPGAGLLFGGYEVKPDHGENGVGNPR